MIRLFLVSLTHPQSVENENNFGTIYRSSADIKIKPIFRTEKEEIGIGWVAARNLQSWTISRVILCPLNSGFILLFGLGEVLAVMNIHVTQHTIDYCIIATDNNIYRLFFTIYFQNVFVRPVLKLRAIWLTVMVNLRKPVWKQSVNKNVKMFQMNFVMMILELIHAKLPTTSSNPGINEPRITDLVICPTARAQTRIVECTVWWSLCK